MRTVKRCVAAGAAAVAIFSAGIVVSIPAQAAPLTSVPLLRERVVKTQFSSDLFLVTPLPDGTLNSKYLTFDAWKARNFEEPEYVSLVPGTKIIKQTGMNSLFAVLDGRETELPPYDWQRLGNPQPIEVQSAFVKYPWDSTVYAVTFLGADRKDWLWQEVGFGEWNDLGQPKPRIAGWVEGSRFYKKSVSSPDIYVSTADVVHDAGYFIEDGRIGQVIFEYFPWARFEPDHKLTFAEWVAAGAPQPELWLNTTANANGVKFPAP